MTEEEKNAIKIAKFTWNEYMRHKDFNFKKRQYKYTTVILSN